MLSTPSFLKGIHINTLIINRYNHPGRFYSLLIVSYQLKLIKMRAELANLNYCAVPFLSRVGSSCADTTILYISNILFELKIHKAAQNKKWL